MSNSYHKDVISRITLRHWRKNWKSIHFWQGYQSVWLQQPSAISQWEQRKVAAWQCWIRSSYSKTRRLGFRGQKIYSSEGTFRSFRQRKSLITEGISWSFQGYLKWKSVYWIYVGEVRRVIWRQNAAVNLRRSWEKDCGNTRKGIEGKVRVEGSPNQIQRIVEKGALCLQY